jgi:hypothetical protein
VGHLEKKISNGGHANAYPLFSGEGNRMGDQGPWGTGETNDHLQAIGQVEFVLPRAAWSCLELPGKGKSIVTHLVSALLIVAKLVGRLAVIDCYYC